MTRLWLAIVSFLNPVTEVLPITTPEPAKLELFPCAYAGCQALLPWGMLSCPLCGHRQTRVRSAVTANQMTDDEVLYALEPDRPYDHAVDGL